VTDPVGGGQSKWGNLESGNRNSMGEQKNKRVLRDFSRCRRKILSALKLLADNGRTHNNLEKTEESRTPKGVSRITTVAGGNLNIPRVLEKRSCTWIIIAEYRIKRSRETLQEAVE